MVIWGISANSHDASISVWNDNILLFAAHSERYSGIKNDAHLNSGIITDAMFYGYPDLIVWYENPYTKTLRQLIAGQGWRYQENNIKSYLAKFNLDAPLVIGSHHESHAAAGYYTSKFDDATIVCIDAIGEFETLTIWEGVNNKIKKRFSLHYPNSIGLWYSAMTQRCNLNPNEEEYILMGMAAYGNPYRFKERIYNDFFEKIDGPNIKFKFNLHRGCKDWAKEYSKEQDIFDIAAGTQLVYTELLQEITYYARQKYSSKNLVLMGGCALNCSANSRITHMWDNIWIMPNPGDAGSSMGAVVAYLGEKIDWYGPYLGTNLGVSYPVNLLVNELQKTKIAGVASGRAEFGPRALGNRSLLADPRGDEIKDKVNEIKRRQKFRPFAPAILAEKVEEFFEMPSGVYQSPYMQFVAKCKYPNMFPAIIHADGTSRVQTVSKKDNSGFRELLEVWYEQTGCPMLLNTSLNIRGKPMVNNLSDAKEFEQTYGVRVFT